MRKKWTTEKIEKLVAFAEKHSVTAALKKFEINTAPQYYQLKRRLEENSAPRKRGPKPRAAPSGSLKKAPKASASSKSLEAKITRLITLAEALIVELKKSR